MNAKMKVYSILSLAVVAALFSALAFAPAAYAFDGRSGDRVVIGKDEVINDDLYLSGREIIVDGTINGDLLAAGEKVTVSGKVTGDLWAAGREVIVSGEVGDDLFAAAAVVTLESTANVVDDFFSAGASVESQPGSKVGGSLLIGAYQGLVAGNVTEDLLVGANRLRLESQIGRDARIAVDTTNTSANFQPYMFGPNMPAMPSVPTGLTFGPEAKVLGNLVYTSSVAVSIPSSVATQVQHLLPPADQQVRQEISVGARPHQDGATSILFNGLRRLIALLLVTAVLAWLIPVAITRPAAKLQSRPLPSFGIGLLGIVAVPFILFFALGVIILVAILFGALTLGELLGAVLGIGLPGLALVAGLFFLMLGYLPQAMVAFLGGRWFFQRVRPETAEKVIWPALLGALVLGLLMVVPVLGGLLEFVVVVAGLGALILLVWERSKKAPTASGVEVVATPPAVEG
jgi:cytoskeletal protein CcmA (bactofilin family)